MTFLNLIRPVISAAREVGAFLQDVHYAFFVQPYEEALVPVVVRVDTHLE